MKKFILILVPFVFLSFVSCGNSSTSTNINSSGEPTPAVDALKPDLNVEQAKKMIDDGKPLTLLDVRTPGEIQSGFIAGAVKIDYNDPSFKEKASALDKNKPTLVYCAVGGRSSKAMQILKDAGFKEVYNMTGGFNAWKSNNYPVVIP